MCCILHLSCSHLTVKGYLSENLQPSAWATVLLTPTRYIPCCTAENHSSRRPRIRSMQHTTTCRRQNRSWVCHQNRRRAASYSQTQTPRVRRTGTHVFASEGRVLVLFVRFRPNTAWVSNPRPASLCYVVRGHICKLRIYYKNYTII
jgi:hypothetical protein